MKFPEGIIAVNKPKGMTSHDVVSYVKRSLNAKKVGHAGTLDPQAEGVLVILVGDATKRQKEFMSQEKEYVAEIKLGAESTTDDIEGEIKTHSVKKQPTSDDVGDVINQFIGEIEQIPPLYSAVKVGGRAAYNRARRGEKFELKPKKVMIKEIKIISYKWPKLKIKVVCSSGTYIRSLARDIGKKLLVEGYLAGLVRTRSGRFTITQAQNLKEV